VDCKREVNCCCCYWRRQSSFATTLVVNQYLCTHHGRLETECSDCSETGQRT